MVITCIARLYALEHSIFKSAEFLLLYKYIFQYVSTKEKKILRLTSHTLKNGVMMESGEKSFPWKWKVNSSELDQFSRQVENVKGVVVVFNYQSKEETVKSLEILNSEHLELEDLTFLMKNVSMMQIFKELHGLLESKLVGL